RPRILPPSGDPGHDQYPGVYLLRPQPGRGVLPGNEFLQARGIDRQVPGIGSELDFGLENRLAARYDISVLRALQYEQGEDEMRGARPDVDTGTDELDLFFLVEGPTAVGETKLRAHGVPAD